MSEPRNRLTSHELARRVENKNLGTLLETNPTFRRFLWTLFTDAGIFYPTFTRGSPHDTSYQEGRRSLGLEVLHRLKHVRPDILSVIEREGNLLEVDLHAAKTPDPEDINDLPPDDDDER